MNCRAKQVLDVAAQAFDELLLIKRGGRTIFFGTTGARSTNICNYFEVGWGYWHYLALCMRTWCTRSWPIAKGRAQECRAFHCSNLMLRVIELSGNTVVSPQAIENVPKIAEDYNPATWMLEVANHSVETRTGQDFAELYNNSDMRTCDLA